jgi:hypothetical protein
MISSPNCTSAKRKKKGYSPLEDLRHDTIEKYESYQGDDPNALYCKNFFGRFWWKKKPE